MCSTKACVLLLACCVLLSSGCGPAESGTSVSGTVTYKGAPLTSGSIGFYPSKGQAVMAALGPDGGYTAALEPGDYKATITVGFEVSPDWKEGDPPPRQSINLPPQYTNRSRSVLKVSVAEGHEEPINFDLK